MRLIFTRVDRVTEVGADVGAASRTFTSDVAGEKTVLEVVWAHVQDGSLVWCLPHDPPRTVRGVPMDRIYEYVIQPIEPTGDE